MLCDLDKVCPALVVKIYVQWLRFKIGGQELYEVWGPYHLIVALLQEVIVISLSTVEYTSVSRVYSTVDSGITNLIHGHCKLSGASSGFDGWLYVSTQA